MNLNDFISTLENHPDQLLHFHYEGSPLLSGAFHVTEIKKVSVQAVNCGGRYESWEEVLVQLWLPENSTTTPSTSPGIRIKRQFLLDTDKVLGIFRTVREKVRLEGNFPVKFEYAASGKPAAHYILSHIQPTDGGLVVELVATVTDCKAKDVCGV